MLYGHPEARAEVYKIGVKLPEPVAGDSSLLMIAVVAGLVLTSLAFRLCCIFPAPRSLSWAGLAAYAVIANVAALIMYSVTLSILCRIFGDQLEASFLRIARKTWRAALWAPPLILLNHGHSPWVAAVAPAMAAQALVLLRGIQCEAELEPQANAAQHQPLFLAVNASVEARNIQPALITSIAFQCGAGLLLLGQAFFAGICFACASVYPVWKLVGRSLVEPVYATGAVPLRRLLVQVFLPLGMTALTLLPSLKATEITGMFARLLRPAATRAALPLSLRHKGNFFSGLILLSSPKTVKQSTVPPIPSSKESMGRTLNRPLEIEFDGVYWYFEPVNGHPLADAPTVHGDPTKNAVHSTYGEPVAMVANQSLSQSLAMTCCKAIRVEILDGEGKLGPIRLEVILKSRAGRTPVRELSLGEVLVPMSAEPHAWITMHPVAETLIFPFPRKSPFSAFDEITVVVKPANERVERGAHIAIRKFTLVP